MKIETKLKIGTKIQNLGEKMEIGTKLKKLTNGERRKNRSVEEGMVQNTQMTQMAQITQETQICSKCLKHADVGGADADFLSACFRLSKTHRRLRGFILQSISTVVAFDPFSATHPGCQWPH